MKTDRKGENMQRGKVRQRVCSIACPQRDTSEPAQNGQVRLLCLTSTPTRNINTDNSFVGCVQTSGPGALYCKAASKLMHFLLPARA